MIEKTLPIGKIVSTSNRAAGGDGDIKILAEDIKRNGLINPVTVRTPPGSPEVFIVTAGRRRIAAARLLGWKEIPCRILEGDEAGRADEIALSENVNRLAMHPLDEAAVFRRLLEAGEPVESIAKRYDRPVSGIWQRIQLTDLNPKIREMFRSGKMDLQSAAMLKSLNEKEQAEFVKKEKGDYEVSAWDVSRFIQELHNDQIYKFLGKDCEKCKTRTFLTDNSLFPETSIRNDSCLDRGCYIKKWTKILESCVKSLKEEHKTHAAASMIVFVDYSVNLQKIFGKSVKIGGADYSIKEYDWDNRADGGGAGKEPCIFVSVDGNRLHANPAYWKAAGKESTTDLKDFSKELKLLELPKDEDTAVREALKAKKISHYNFSEKVRKEVLLRLITARADTKGGDDLDAALVLRKAFNYPSEKQKKIFSLFTGKEYAGKVEEILDLETPLIFGLLYALELNEYDIPPVYSEKETPEVFEWSGLFPDEIKKIYQEVIRELLPKPKAGKAAAKGKEKKG
jgi:ParB/RepB/Spo0J family partition protein